MAENKAKYIIGKNTKNGRKVIGLVYGSVDLKLPTEMTYVGGSYLQAEFYHINCGATVSINTPSSCPASGVDEVFIEIFARKEETRERAKSTLEQFLGFKF